MKTFEQEGLEIEVDNDYAVCVKDITTGAHYFYVELPNGEIEHNGKRYGFGGLWQ